MLYYGKELILDLHGCNIRRFTRESLKKYFIAICDLIKMERENLYFWDYEDDPEGYEKAPLHLKGISAVQFIKTSNITVHTLDELRKVFINIFSCKEFDHVVARKYTEKWFGGQIKQETFIARE